MLWGLRLERPIADEYRVRHAKRNGVYVAPSPGLLRSEEYPWLAATPDRVLLDRATRSTAVGLLEIKTNAWSLEREWSDGPPDYYQLQTQVQMGVTGVEYVDLVPLFGGNRMPDPHRIEFDPEAWRQIVEITGEWWHAHIVERTVPELMVTDLEHLPQVWPGDDNATAVLPLALVQQLAQRDRIKDRIKQLQEAADRVELRVKAAMGDAKVAYYQPPTPEDALTEATPIKVASWSRTPRKQFKQKEFTADHPDLAEQYTTTGSTQRFTPNKAIHNLTTEE
jgi:predicted phage-related endonuclease